MNLQHKLKTAFEVWQRNGWSGLKNYIQFQLISLQQKFAYRKWVRQFGTLTEETRAKIRAKIEQFSHKPSISIILPVYDVEEKFLRLCIESVRQQIYENWELCIADDCSPSPHIQRILKEYKKEDSRIKVVFRKENGHISAASNSALELATGEFTVLMDHDDEISEHALFYIAREINEHPDVKMIYSDEDLIDKKSRRFGPKFKPDWSRDFFYSTNLITHLSGYETALLKRIGGFTVGLDGSQDYDLALRVIEEIPEGQIRHIPRILYHWRVIETSVASGGHVKPYAHQAARDAIAAHLKRIGKNASVSETVYNLHRVHYTLPPIPPRVSLICLPVRDQSISAKSLEEIISRTGYPKTELIVLCPIGMKDTFENSLRENPYSKNKIAVSVLESELNEESSLLNFGAASTTAEIICFVELNLRPLSKNWLEEMVSFAAQDEIGAVGAKLLDCDSAVLHGGLVTGIGGSVGVAHQNYPKDKAGNITRNLLIGNYSAVSVSCMAVRRKVFNDLGGFDSQEYPNRLFDANLCLRLRAQNMRIIWTPYAELSQINSSEPLNVQREIGERESAAFSAAWQDAVRRDPFYNPNFSRRCGKFLIQTKSPGD